MQKRFGGYIIAGSWFLLGIIALFSFISWLGQGRLPFDIKDFNPGSAVTTVENFSDAAINTLDISIISDRVIVSGSGRDDFEVTVSSNLSDDFKPKALVKDGVLYITQKSNRSFWGSFGNGYVEVIVPSSVMKREDFIIQASSVSGSVSISDCAADKIGFSSTSGSIRGSNLRTPTLKASSVSGSVKMENCDVQALEVKSTSGSVSFSGSCDFVTAASVSGSVKVRSSTMLTRDSTLKSMSGSVHLYIPNNDGFIMDYSSMSGSARNSFNGLDSKKSGKNKYGNGGITLNLESMSGSVSVERY